VWLILALFAAALTTARESAVKAAMGAADEEALVLGITVVALAVLLPPVLLSEHETPATSFWPALLVSGSINALASVLIARAVHRGELSIVMPLQSFTPLFMLATSPIILGERPTLAGAAGVVAIVAGSYVLRLPERAGGPLAPFTALLRDTAARLMLWVAFLYSVSSTIDKVGVLASDPLLWGIAVQTFVAVALAVRLATRRSGSVRLGRSRLVFAGGVALGLTIAAQMTALTLALAAYVIAVKRTSIVLSVVAGRVFFGERGLRDRFAGAALMLIGVVLITLS